METGKNYAGFRVIKHEFVKEVNADAFLMEHAVSGARLLYLASEDDNKVFTIGFRTPPADDTGGAHILEHIRFMRFPEISLKGTFRGTGQRLFEHVFKRYDLSG